MIRHLTIICFIVLLVEVLSQGGGGGGGSICAGAWIECAKGTLLYMLELFAISFCAVLLCGCINWCIENRASKKDPNGVINKDLEKGEQTEHDLTVSISIDDIFQSGTWSSRYHQYNKWHGSFKHEIVFDIDQNMLSGHGKDIVGQYTLTGHISTELLTINMIKEYRLDTGDARENLGHEVKIDLKWNNRKRVFVGQWFVHTHKYQGEGQYELVKLQQQSM